MKKRIVIPLAFLFSFMLIIVFASSAGASPNYQDDQIQHGKYIATIAGCTDCHTPLKAEYQDPTKYTLEQLQVISFNAVAASDETKLLSGGRAFDIAPADLRGRYMSMHWLGWGLARTLSPIIGGFLNDTISPRSIWIGGLIIGLISVSGIFLFNYISSSQTSPQPSP